MVKTVERLRGIPAGIFHKQCDTALYTITYHLTDHMVDDMRKFEAPPVLAICVYEQCSVHVKQAVKEILLRRGR